MKDELKKKEELPNKAFYPAGNKAADTQVRPNKIRIKIRPGRAAAGVTVDKDGYALVDGQTAERLYQIGYAIKENEHGN